MTATIVEMVRGLDAEALVSLRERARARLDERLRERTDVALVGLNLADRLAARRLNLTLIGLA